MCQGSPIQFLNCPLCIKPTVGVGWLLQLDCQHRYYGLSAVGWFDAAWGVSAANDFSYATNKSLL